MASRDSFSVWTLFAIFIPLWLTSCGQWHPNSTGGQTGTVQTDVNASTDQTSATSSQPVSNVADCTDVACVVRILATNLSSVVSGVNVSLQDPGPNNPTKTIVLSGTIQSGGQMIGLGRVAEKYNGMRVGTQYIAVRNETVAGDIAQIYLTDTLRNDFQSAIGNTAATAFFVGNSVVLSGTLASNEQANQLVDLAVRQLEINSGFSALAIVDQFTIQAP